MTVMYHTSHIEILINITFTISIPYGSSNLSYKLYKRKQSQLIINSYLFLNTLFD